MRRNLEMRFLGAGVFICFLFVTIVAMTVLGNRCALPDANSFGRRCGDAISNWLYDYQTLVTGFAAVIAALWTIVETRKAANRQISSQNYRARGEIEYLFRALNEPAQRVIKYCDAFVESVDNKYPNRRQNFEFYRVMRSLEDFRETHRSAVQQSYQVHFDSKVKDALDQLQWHEQVLKHRFRDYEVDGVLLADTSWMDKVDMNGALVEQVKCITPDFTHAVVELARWRTEKLQELA